MSSVGHLMVGAAASRYSLDSPRTRERRLFWVLMTGIAVLPDIDLALLGLGVPRWLILGHRGATHSLVAALVVVTIVTLLAAAVRLPWRRVAVGSFVAIGSHALLDSFTPGPGVAWLWPFSNVRFPTWPILPMAPLGDDVSARTFLILLVAEIVVFSPFVVYAVLGRRPDH